jgi:hypothetical protein
MGGGGGMGGQHGGQGGGMGSMMPGAWGNARMPVPGNAEFLFFVVAMILLALIALFADSFDTPGWVDVFKWLGSAYLLSRGIAKASRVLEN